jgi:PAS domain-containing protein
MGGPMPGTIRHPAPSDTRPAGLCTGPGHVVAYGNPAFVATFGAGVVGMPAREVMLDLPEAAFDLLDLVYERGRPLARWIRRDGRDWRLTVTPRRDAETNRVYGVAFHLRARDDVPVVDHAPDR